MAVGARVGLGDREHHLLARAETGEPAGALRVGPEPGEQLGGDARRHEEQEQRAPLRRRGLAHHDQLAQPAAATAVLLGEVHREEAGCGHRLPELVGATAGARLVTEPVVSEAGRHVARGGAQHRVLVGPGEVHGRMLARRAGVP